MATQDFTPTSDSPREADDAGGIKDALTAALAEHEAAAEEGDDGEGKPEIVESEKPAVEAPGAEKGEAEKPEGGEKPAVETKKPADKNAAADKGEKGEKSEKKPGEDAPKPGEPPAHWSAEHKKVFATLAPEGKTFVLGRMKDMEADYTRKTQEIAGLRKEYEAVDQIFTPQRDKLKAANLTASQVIQGWANAEIALQSGDPTTQINLLAGVAKSYKVDPIQLATQILIVAGIADPKAALEGAAAQAAERAKSQPAAVVLPPEVMAKLGKVDQIAAHVEGQQRASAEAEVTRINNELETFKAATDAGGALLHPYFDELMEDMGRLVEQATAAKRPVPPIDQLYQEAIFANPAVRQKHIDGQVAAASAKAEAAQRTAAEKAAAEARAKSEKARKAGSSVTGSSGPGQSLNGRNGKDAGSLRQALAAAVEEHETVVH